MALIFILILLGLAVAYYDRSVGIVTLQRQVDMLLRRLNRIETTAAAAPVNAVEGFPSNSPAAAVVAIEDDPPVVAIGWVYGRLLGTAKGAALA